MIDDRGNSMDIVLAFLSGAALGSIAALLLAPQSGEESREQLTGYARRAGDDLRNFAGRARDAYDDMADQGQKLGEAAESAFREGSKSTS